MITKFEQFPNELILICFSYLNLLELYETFSHLNQRFNQLIQYDAKLCIDLNSIPDTKFLTFCMKLNQFITTTQNYPLSIIAHDQYKFNLIFYDDLFQGKFDKLKSLTLSNIKVENIYSIIFETTAKLDQSLERLNLLDGIRVTDRRTELDVIQSKKNNFNLITIFVYLALCNNLISSKMKSLTYLRLNFEPYSSSLSDDINLNFNELSKREKSLSHLESLIIGSKLF
jgi:hypothetical protein